MLILVTFLTGLLCVYCATKPNILFILVNSLIFLKTDDLGTGEVGVYPASSPHGRIPTPNIDKYTFTE